MVASDRGSEFLRTVLGQIHAGQRGAAWRELRRSLPAVAADPEAQVQAARVLVMLGDGHQALHEARAASLRDSEEASAFLYKLALEIGAFQEAVSLRERQLDQRLAGDHESWLGDLLKIYFDHQCDERAVALLQRHLGSAAHSPLLWLQAARLYERIGRVDQGVEALRQALASGSSAQGEALDVLGLLLELGAFDAATQACESLLKRAGTRPKALETLARITLWRGEYGRAAALANQLDEEGVPSPAAARIRAAARIHDRDFEGARHLLDEALAKDPNDGEAYLWRAEALWRLGRFVEAAEDCDRSLQRGYSFAANAVRMLAVLFERASEPPHPNRGLFSRLLERWRGPSTPHPPALDGTVLHVRKELRAELEAMFDATDILERGNSEELAGLLERALAKLAGNRTPIATWVDSTGTLKRLPRSRSARILSRRTLDMIRVVPVDECFRRLDELAAEFPQSSMPLVHRGELQLWLGRLDEAEADLRASIARLRQTRWAWYGLGWHAILSGDPEKALALCSEGIREMNNTEGPVAFMCRGEALRILGRLDDARRELEHAVKLNPTRLSGWVNLALVEGPTRGITPQIEIVRRVQAAAPALCSEAAWSLGEEAFIALVVERRLENDETAGGCAVWIDAWMKQVLHLMRGNRASGLITYFDRDGALRHVPSRTLRTLSGPPSARPGRGEAEFSLST